MKIINVSTALIKNGELFKEYIAKAAVLMNEQEVEVVCRAKYVETLQGAKQGDHIMAIFKYKNMEAFDYFYGCKAYKKIVPLRDKACEMTINVYSEL